MRRPYLPDRVVPAVIPGDAGLSIHQRPGSMGCPERLPCTAVSIERDEECVAVGALAYFPLAEKMRPPRRHRAEPGTLKLNAGDVSSCNFLLMAIFENNHRRSLEVDALDLGHGKALPMPVLEY